MNNKKIFEKIITEKRAKSSNERPKYGLRKLTVGVVSCLLGYMMFMTPNVTLADKVEQPKREEAVVEKSNEETKVAAQSKAQAIEKSEEKSAEEIADEKAKAEKELANYKTEAIKKIEKAFEDVDAEKSSKTLDEYKEEVEKTESKEAIDKIVADANADAAKAKETKTDENKDEAALEIGAETNAKDEVLKEAAPGTEAKNKDLEEKGDKNRDKVEPKANPLDFGLKKDGTIEEKNAADAVANKAELTEAKSYDWVKKPEFGDTEAQVKVTYKDGSYDILKVAITTPKKPDEREDSKIITKGGNSFEDAIDASTDKTPKSKQTLAGFAWIENEPAFGSRDDGDIPAAGKKVYAQWKDGNGVVSPIFSTVVREDGSFIFDLSRPVKNADGSFTEFKFAVDANFGVKIWAEEMEGYSIVKNGDMYSDYITRTHRTATGWNFTAGINYVDNAQIQYQRKPNVEKWLAKPEDQWVRPETPDGRWPDNGDCGVMRGIVWNENGETGGGVTNEYLFQKGNGDVAAVGTEVVASYVNDEVARQFDAWAKANKGYTHEQFKQAQKKIIEDYDAQHGVGSAIAETVVGKVDKDGNYRIPFRGLYGADRNVANKGAKISWKITDEEFGQLVKDDEVNHTDSRLWDKIIGLRVRHINWDYSYVYPLVPENRNVWMKMYEDNMFQSSYSIGGQMNAGTNISGIQFALLASRAQHNIINKDTNENFGKPGEVVLNKSQGLHNNQEYVVRWFRDGKPIGEAKKVISDKDGALSSFDVTVDNDLTQDTMYTSAVFPPNSKADKLDDAILADSFVARPIVKKVNKADPVKDGYVRVSFLSGEDGKFDGGATEQYYDILENYTLAEAKEAAKGSAAPLNIPNATPNKEKSTFEAWKLDTNNTLQSLDAENLKLKDLADANNKLKEGVPVTFVAGYAIETEKSKYEPKYKEVDGKVGEVATVAAPTFTDKEGKQATPQGEVTYEKGEGAPAGAVVNADGSVTYTPKAGEEGQAINVPVVVTYSDGTKDNATATINVAKLDDIIDR
uniref:Rib/alpha-like domain-containing protein n=1 Tax=Finegoldia magna TaxID=1260 RepID=UPI0026EA88D2